MSRVVLVCPERLGHRHPAGVGIRFLEFARALRDDGHEVEVLSPDAGAIPDCRCAPLTPESIRAATARAEVAVVQGHAANELFAYGSEIPTVVDLYDPYIIENFHYFEAMGERVFRHDHATLMASVRRGDFFLCASEAQRMFYAGLLVAAGRVNPVLFESDPALGSLLRIVPFGVQPPRPFRTARPAPAVFFGAIYDWYDPMLAIEAIAIARARIPEISLTFTHHPNADQTPQSLFGRVAERVRRERMEGFIRFEPWAPYEERAASYERFALALLTFRPSLETDLAMRTRMFDCFWGELPVVTSSAGGTDAIVARYGAGAVVEEGHARAYADALVALLDPPARERAVEGCRAFTRDHQWPRLLEPLLAFCREPMSDRTKEEFTTAPEPLRARPEPLLRRVRRALGGTR